MKTENLPQTPPEYPPTPFRTHLTFRNSRIIYYGPHACENCGILICKMGREFGGNAFTYPEGPIYPNTEWHPHVCDPKNVARSTVSAARPEWTPLPPEAKPSDSPMHGRPKTTNQPEPGNTPDIVERLYAACHGHPHAKIPWPHRILHDAADEILALRAENTHLRDKLQQPASDAAWKDALSEMICSD